MLTRTVNQIHRRDPDFQTLLQSPDDLDAGWITGGPIVGVMSSPSLCSFTTGVPEAWERSRTLAAQSEGSPSAVWERGREE